VGGWTITTVPIGFTLEELARLKLELLHGAPYASRVSLGLAMRLVQHPNERPAVLREIDALEGLRPATTTKIGQFKYAPLAPFWHKHFFSPRHVLRNIGERWNIARGQGNRDLDSVLSEVASKYGDDPTRWPRALVHRLYVGGFEERAAAQRLTGDWIIFAKHDGQNYYLDLATHEEAQGQANSERLMQKLRVGGRAEFPFLF
jgi:hypothetical protein